MKIVRVLGDLAHRCASNSIPVMFSIQISKTATGTECVARWLRNASGSPNSATLYPEDSRTRVRDFRTDGSSSTTEIAGARLVIRLNTVLDPRRAIQPLGLR